MATVTYDSVIKSKVDVTASFNLAEYGPCKHCGRLPTIYKITWGSRKNTGHITECCEAGGGWLENWKRCNAEGDNRNDF